MPKIIWQTHNYKYEDLPDHLKKVTKTWINLNPGWEYRYVDNEERDRVIKKDYPAIYPSYKQIEWDKSGDFADDFYTTYMRGVMQSDIWRMLTLYEHGGVYADMDSICIKPLDYELEKIGDKYDAAIVPQQAGHLRFNNCNFAVTKNNYALGLCIEEALNEDFINLNLRKKKDPLTVFSQTMGNFKTSYKNFDIAIHSKDFKTEFFNDFLVDYYGKLIKYTDLIKDLNLEI
jgi:hypothetical protein